MRKLRLIEIQRIISHEEITSQESLIKKLNESNFRITQATLSRDLAYLKVGKFFIPNKGYIYVLPQDLRKMETITYQPTDKLAGVISIKFSRNIAVFRTLPGYAAQVCVNIDNANIQECVGTIAGEDTIMIVIDEDITQGIFKKVFIENFPELKDKF